MTQLHTSEVDGIATFWVETGRPTLSASLLFRQAFEQLGAWRRWWGGIRRLLNAHEVEVFAVLALLLLGAAVTLRSGIGGVWAVVLAVVAGRAWRRKHRADPGTDPGADPGTGAGSDPGTDSGDNP